MKNMANVLIVALSIFVLMLSVVSAQVVPGGATTTSVADRGTLAPTSADNVSVQAGNMSQANLETNQTTGRWSGLVGNVTGTIQLGDSSGNVFYSWPAAGLLVYASELGTVDWGSLADANQAAVVADYAFLTSGVSDSYNLTFNGSQNIGSIMFPSLTSDFANVSASGNDWYTYSLTDGSGGTDIVFATGVNEDTNGYDGISVDYQILLPEDGTGGDVAVTEYNLWVELQ